jgi:sugar O-acyltransferase (sialic acid O-acetyltransferase NeuD family)
MSPGTGIDHGRERMNDRRLVLMGGGGHAAVVADAARAAGWDVLGFVDEAPGIDAEGLTRLGDVDALDRILTTHDATAVHAAIGGADRRRDWLDHAARLADPVAIVHPASIVAATARLEDGVFVGPGAVVNARARIGRGAIVNSAAVIEHDCVIGAFAHVAPAAVLGGDVSVGADALVGIGAVVRPGVTVGAEAIVGAGAVAVSDIAAGACVAGVPARPLPIAAQAVSAGHR